MCHLGVTFSITGRLHDCYRGFEGWFQGSYKGVTGVLQGNNIGVTGMLQGFSWGFFTGGTGLIQGYRVNTVVLPECYKFVTGVLQVYPGTFPLLYPILLCTLPVLFLSLLF